ncbi:unnamed protein product [Discosporangium mesarthrocarpum]
MQHPVLSPSRTLAVKAHRLREEGDPQMAWLLYKEALKLASGDLSLQFLAHTRLAALELEGHGRENKARWHLETAWDIGMAVAKLSGSPPLKCVLATGNELALLVNSKTPTDLLVEGDESASFKSKEKYKSTQSSSGCPRYERGSPLKPSAGYQISEEGRGERGEMVGSCDTCGKVGTEEDGRLDGGEGGQEWYCWSCIEAYNKAIAMGPSSDGTIHCANCDDNTVPVSIDVDARWYCEACMAEWYEEPPPGVSCRGTAP